MADLPPHYTGGFCKILLAASLNNSSICGTLTKCDGGYYLILMTLILPVSKGQFVEIKPKFSTVKNFKYILSEKSKKKKEVTKDIYLIT